MAELVLGPVAEATVSSLIAHALEQLKLALGWKGDLKMFCRNMRMVRDVLRRADEKNVSSNNSELKTWLQDLGDIADEADDLLEEVAYEMLRRRLAHSKWKKASYLFTLSNPLLFRLRMANKAKDLKSRLAVLNANAASFGLQITLATAVDAPMANPEQTNSFLSSHLVGREDDVSRIESLLTDSTDHQQQDLPVTVIVGMPGLGKTTLAKAVSRTDKICQHFGNILWVCVSENFDRLSVLKMMLESLGSDDGVRIISEDAALRKIQDKLGEKGFLLILDDVWNEERPKWEGLRSCLLGISKNKGSRVLVTTRSEKVARIMIHDDKHIVGLQEMTADECWDIIKQRAVGSFSIGEEFEKVGKQIGEKCKGVPLVASLIGATLLNRRDLHEWELILQDHVWSSLERENRVLDIVRFSYDRLPELALKQCFAFCSIFPKDTVMERDVLIQLWMANGFLSPPEDSSVSMEDIGEKYYSYLLSYSLFQEENDWRGAIIACKMHDLIHDFAESISHSEIAIVDKESENKLPSSIRHLNIVSGGEMVPPILRDAAPKLRTLLFSDNDTPNGVQSDFKRLRVLNVSKASDAKQLSKCFGNSKSLRYLDISGTEMKEFPKFIKKLYNLQTLRLMNCRSLRMPAEGLRDLINLSHIYLSDEGCMPANLGSLTNLQTLNKFYVGESKGRRIGELGSLSRLRGKLAIYRLEFVEGKSEAEKAKLHEKALDELSLYWAWSRSDDRSDDEGVLEGLLPHSSLQKLYIHYFGGTCLPSWMLKSGDNRFQFNNLVVLKIERTKLKSIPVMEGFSSLKELSIWRCEELTDGAFAFQSLKKLSILNCPNVEFFSFSGLTSLEELLISGCGVVNITGDGLSSCTHLRILLLSSCHNLKSIPDLHGLSSLREVVIGECGELACLPSGWSSCTALEVQSLVKLAIWSCPKLSSFPEEMLGCLSKLKKLKIGGFSNEELEEFPGLSSINNLSASIEDLMLIGWEKLTEVPSEIQALTALKSLVISCFNGVEALPEWLGEFSSLKSLSIRSCNGLKSLESGLPSCTSLEKLSIQGCDNLVSLPVEFSSLKSLSIASCSGLKSLESGLPSCTSLEKLVIYDCDNLVSLPVELKELRSLVELSIKICPKLRSFPEEILGGLTRLQTLEMGPFCEDLEEFIGLSSIHHLHSSLEELRLSGWGEKLAELPQQIQHLTALRTLSISRFEGMEALPDWLAENLPSLQSLYIFECPKLNKTLPSAQLIKRLSKLINIFLPDWPELEEKIRQEKRSAAR